MSDETGTSREVTSCGISVSADKTRLFLYLGSTETDKSFEFIMPKTWPCTCQTPSRSWQVRPAPRPRSGAARGRDLLGHSGLIGRVPEGCCDRPEGVQAAGRVHPEVFPPGGRTKAREDTL